MENDLKMFHYFSVVCCDVYMEFFLLYAVLMYTCLRDVSTLRAQFDFVGLQLNRIFCITGNWR